MATRKTQTGRKTQAGKDNVEFVAKLMKDIDIAMFTTVGEGGYLVSRPLSTQHVTFDGERVWFFTEADSPKVAEIKRNRKVNLAYASDKKNTYISVTGDASLNRDQSRIDQFWNDALKAFFPKGRTDPNLTLIEVALHTAEYWDGPGTLVGKAVRFVLARVTGNDDVMGKTRIVDLETGRSRKPPSNDTAPRKTKKAVKAVSRPLIKKTATKKVATRSTAGKSSKSGAVAGKSATAKKAATRPAKKAARKQSRS